MHQIRKAVVATAVLATAAALTGSATGTAWAIPAAETIVTEGSPPTPFSQNKQNEPWVAIDPSNPQVLAAGANDNIDMEACNAGDPTTCPFTDDVGVSGISFSLNGGSTWDQPTYTGNSARHCLGPAACVVDPNGPIGTLPGYAELNLVSDGDPSLVFGPRPSGNGTFSWANGSRLYYANLVSKTRAGDLFKGPEAIAVSRTDNVPAAAAGSEAAWMSPVIVSRQSSTTFSDKEAIWADNAATSDYFGNVYLCNVSFRSNGRGGAPEPVMFHRSTDGGSTWTSRQISQAANTNVSSGRAGGRQGCVVRTTSTGDVYVFWRGSFAGADVVWMAVSTNGGVGFARPRVVAHTGTVGQFDPVTGRYTIDGVAGARTNEGPTADIANGAPSGVGAPDTILLGWNDGRLGLNHERSMVRLSTNGGRTWAEYDATAAGDRPNFSWVAISPDGTDLWTVYNAYHAPWAATTATPRPMEGVVRHADTASPAAWATVHRGATGDARASSANGLTAEFLGDYNYVAATNNGAYAVWNDVRNAADCPAIDAYRQSVADGAPTAPPAPQVVCAPTFGNTDIYGVGLADPS
jgi:hypothetical protein